MPRYAMRGYGLVETQPKDPEPFLLFAPGYVTNSLKNYIVILCICRILLIKLILIDLLLLF